MFSYNYWKQHLKVIILGLVIIAGILAMFLYSMGFESTDNAYINGDSATISSQVTGPIKALAIENHQLVSRGDLLMTIDPRPALLAVRQAEAQLALSRQQSLELFAQVQVMEANLNQTHAQMEDAKRSLERTQQLVPKGFQSTEDLDKAVTLLKSATAAYQSSAAQLDEAKINSGQAGDDNAQVQVALAALETAKLNLAYTQITAPSDGQIINLTNRPGDVVQAGQALFALISHESMWVDANFKETQLQLIKLGQAVEVVVDTFPDVTLKGEVEKISAGSGSAYSLLPPQNASGNWVKITQRFPVKIRLINPPSTIPLRVGMSANVSVRLK